MARDPSDFRGMSFSQIVATMVSDEAEDRHRQAASVGARCVRCLDSGMAGGSFCGCRAGAALGMQSNRG